MDRLQAVFISDAHLEAPDDPNYQKMLAFLAELAHPRPPEELFILGDFFAYWMGFSSVPAIYRPVVEKLHELVDGGARLTYVEGNHDIDMGRYFEKKLGARIIADWGEARVAGKRLYLAHGDRVDKQDRNYRMFRAFIRSWPMRGLSHALTPERILRIARPYAFDGGGGVYYAGHLPELMEAFAREKWRDGYDGVVLGHCHHPALIENGGGTRFYANLGDWVGQFTYLAADAGGFRLHRYPGTP